MNKESIEVASQYTAWLRIQIEQTVREETAWRARLLGEDDSEAWSHIHALVATRKELLLALRENVRQSCRSAFRTIQDQVHEGVVRVRRNPRWQRVDRGVDNGSQETPQGQ